MNEKELRAKDILATMKPRKSLAEQMLERMAGRAFQRPKVATSSKLYEYFDIPDPYAPKPHIDKWEAKLGPTALRLGENRRQPAPHMKVKDPNKKKSKPASKPFRPQGVPQAKTRSEAPMPAPPPLAKQSKASKEFGQKVPHKLVGKLPVRPDMKAQIEAQRQGDHKSVKQPGKPVAPSKVSRQISAEELSARKPPSPTKEARVHQSRFRMRRTKVTNQEPVIRKIDKPQVSQAEPPPKKEKPVDRSIPKSNASAGIDDLFGFGNQEEGRVRLPKRTKKK